MQLEKGLGLDASQPYAKLVVPMKVPTQNSPVPQIFRITVKKVVEVSNDRARIYLDYVVKGDRKETYLTSKWRFLPPIHLWQRHVRSITAT